MYLLFDSMLVNKVRNDNVKELAQKGQYIQSDYVNKRQKLV